MLREVSLVSSDYVKRMYLEELLGGGPLTADEVRALFRQVGREMDSDYERQRVEASFYRHSRKSGSNRETY